MDLATFFQLELLNSLVLGDCGEEGIDHRVRVSFTTLASISTVIHACEFEHLPDLWVAPVVWLALRPNADFEVVVTAFEYSWHCLKVIPVQNHHVRLQLLEGIIEGALVVCSLALAKANHSSLVADKD